MQCNFIQIVTRSFWNLVACNVPPTNELNNGYDEDELCDRLFTKFSDVISGTHSTPHVKRNLNLIVCAQSTESIQVFVSGLARMSNE